MTSGVFISGPPGSGKTGLAMNMAKCLAENNVILYIVAPAPVWTEKFYLVKNVYNIESLKNLLLFIDWNAHCIFDTSKLAPDEQREFIELLSREIIKVATSVSPKGPNRMVIFDECHMPMYNGFFETNQAEYTKQLLTVGRNLGIRFIAITQSPTKCDKLLVTLAQQRYFFCTSEKNDIGYVRGFVGKWLEDLPKLKPGECIYCYGDKAKKIEIPKFDETSQLPILPRRSKFIGATGPLLTKAIEEAEPIRIGTGRNHYEFLVYPFGEAAGITFGDLIQEITNHLDELITNAHLKFDYIVSPRYGSRWVWPLAQKHGYNVISVIERPHKLVPKLEKRGDEAVHLKTKLYSRKVYFRGVKPGDEVIIVDDVISEGRTMKAVINALRKHGVKILGAFCIVARGDGYKSVEKLGVPVWYCDHRVSI